MIAAGRLDRRFFAESRAALAEAEARTGIDYAEPVDAESTWSACPAGGGRRRARRPPRGCDYRAGPPRLLGLHDARCGRPAAAEVAASRRSRPCPIGPRSRARAGRGRCRPWAADTCWTMDEKAEGVRVSQRVPYGVPGSTVMRVISLRRLCGAHLASDPRGGLCREPGEDLGLYRGRAGRAQDDADLVLFDPRKIRISSNERYTVLAAPTPSIPSQVAGVPVLTLSRTRSSPGRARF